MKIIFFVYLSFIFSDCFIFTPKSKIMNTVKDIIDFTSKSSMVYSLFPFLVLEKSVADDNNVGTIREFIAKSASKFPSFGETDIFYPMNWKGSWKTKRLITNITFVDGYSINDIPSIYSNIKNQSSYIYKTDFVSYDNKVIKNRRTSLVTELKSYIDNNNLYVFWEENNPNILKVSLPSLNYDFQISKRAVETNDLVVKNNSLKSIGYSEFGRIVEIQSLTKDKYSSFDKKREISSVPKQFTFRSLVVLENYNDDSVIGVERFYIYPSENLDLIKLKANPILSIKSRILMEKM